MYVQMCIKGVNNITLSQAQDVLADDGLTCNWWRERGKAGGGISPLEIDERLSSANLDLHVNSYEEKTPGLSRVGKAGNSIYLTDSRRSLAEPFP